MPHLTTTADANVSKDAGVLLDLMLEWVPDETTRNRILVDNANRLYGFQREDTL